MALSILDTHSLLKVRVAPMSPVRRRLLTLPSPEPDCDSDAPDAIVAPDCESWSLSRAESFRACWCRCSTLASRASSLLLISWRAYTTSPGTVCASKHPLIVAVASLLPVPSPAQWLIAFALFCNSLSIPFAWHGWHLWSTALYARGSFQFVTGTCTVTSSESDSTASGSRDMAPLRGRRSVQTWFANDGREGATVVSRASNSTKRSLKGNSLPMFPMIGVTVPNVTLVTWTHQFSSVLVSV